MDEKEFLFYQDRLNADEFAYDQHVRNEVVLEIYAKVNTMIEELSGDPDIPVAEEYGDLRRDVERLMRLMGIQNPYDQPDVQHHVSGDESLPF